MLENKITKLLRIKDGNAPYPQGKGKVVAEMPDTVHTTIVSQFCSAKEQKCRSAIAGAGLVPALFLQGQGAPALQAHNTIEHHFCYAFT